MQKVIIHKRVVKHKSIGTLMEAQEKVAAYLANNPKSKMEIEYTQSYRVVLLKEIELALPPYPVTQDMPYPKFKPRKKNYGKLIFGSHQQERSTSPTAWKKIQEENTKVHLHNQRLRNDFESNYAKAAIKAAM